jgi:hypothetical protein
MGNSPEICRHYAALIPEALGDSVEFTDSPEVPRQILAGETVT